MNIDTMNNKDMYDILREALYEFPVLEIKVNMPEWIAILNSDNEISNIKNNSNSYVEYLEIIKDFLNMKNPTKEMMNRIIDKIYITKDKKIEIHYRISKSEILV